MSLIFHNKSTSMSLRVHNSRRIRFVSLRLPFDFTSASLRCHFDFASMTLRSHSDVTSVTLRCHFGVTLVSLRFLFALTSRSRRSHFGSTPNWLWMNFESTPSCKTEEEILHEPKGKRDRTPTRDEVKFDVATGRRAHTNRLDWSYSTTNPRWKNFCALKSNLAKNRHWGAPISLPNLRQDNFCLNLKLINLDSSVSNRKVLCSISAQWYGLFSATSCRLW